MLKDMIDFHLRTVNKYIIHISFYWDYSEKKRIECEEANIVINISFNIENHFEYI
jgi:hypothetical protein